jgi:hypothetical protein
MEKECLCGGLSTAFFYENSMNTKVEGDGVTICPGPNLAYFSGKISLQDMIGHIYGKKNVLNQTKRPHMFLKELELYVKYFLEELDKYNSELNQKMLKYLRDFQANLFEGIDYYKSLFLEKKSIPSEVINDVIEKLNDFENNLKANIISEKTSVLT